MLTQTQLTALYQRLGLSEVARAVVDKIRDSPPTRRVGSRRGNVSVRYPSRKMGLVIQAESHKNELAGIYEMEYDPDTLEYYDQPGPIQLIYPSKNGRSVTVRHTPDFFVLRSQSMGWEEWKTEAELIKLSEQQPHRYVRGVDETWSCPPGEAYAQPFGFFYRIRSSAEIDWVFQRNLRFMEDYLRDDCPEVNPAIVTAVIKLVQEQPGLNLTALRTQVEGVEPDSLYQLIVTDQIYCDLRAIPLTEPDRVKVYLNREIGQMYRLAEGVSRPLGSSRLQVRIGERLLWDNRLWFMVNLGEQQHWLQAEDGRLVTLPIPIFENLVNQGAIKSEGAGEEPLCQAAQDILSRASLEDLQEANRRYQIIAPLLKGQPADTTTPGRTRLWLARYRQAEQAWGNGYLGLIPQRAKRGNRQAKLPVETDQLMTQFIETSYETLKQKSKRLVYGELVAECLQQGLVAPSYPTFCQQVGRRPRYEQLKQRQGPRAAYPYEPFYYELSQTTPRHGDRPFEIVHIDHTQLDIELICSRTATPLGRPWATFLMDAYSRRLLAFYLTFDPPSYRSCMMVIRECVRRHTRFPQTIVVDGGKEFASTYFETLLARYECTKKTRPGSKPRFGSVCERLFGTSHSTFIHHLEGNTQLMRQPRQVTRSLQPRQRAQWTLEALWLRLGEWAYEVYDTLEHPALGQSPRACFTQGMAQSGLRPHRLVAFNQEFQIFSLPTTAKGQAMIRPNLGVKINYIYYWAEDFRDPQLEQTLVPVRYDPFNLGLAYAYVKGRWVQAVSEHYAALRGRSERELMLAVAELRQRQRQHSRHFALTARQLATFLGSVEAEELLQQQRLRDAAGQAIGDKPADLTPAQPSQPPSPPPSSAANPESQPIEYGDF